MRVSGPDATAVFDLFGVARPTPRLASVRRLKTPDGRVLDEALVLWLPGPGTATGEDMAELHLHGSPAIVGRALELLQASPSFALAERGEFSRRAFHNNRLDLLQVEGLADVMEAESEGQRRLAMRQFLGDASALYETWRSDMVRALSLVEAAIDFSEEDDVAERAGQEAIVVIDRLCEAFGRALDQSEKAAQVRRGLRVVLAGPPNAGKSSLVNWLAGRDAAIVSPLAGTTRDVVEAPVVLAGVPLLISDTAGLRNGTEDDIEREGMRRTLKAVGDADVLVWLEAVDDAGEMAPPRAPALRVRSKIDLVHGVSGHTFGDGVWPVSVKTGAGLQAFKDALEELIRERNHVGEDAVVVRLRHRLAVASALDSLRCARGAATQGLEFMAEDMRKAVASLSGVTGRIDVEDLLGEIFSSFCIGK